MNAIAFAGELDLHKADRIIGTRLDGTLLFGLHILEGVFRIVGVGRIPGDHTLAYYANVGSWRGERVSRSAPLRYC